MRNRFAFIILLILGAFNLVYCQTRIGSQVVTTTADPAPTSLANAGTLALSPDVLIGPGDLLEIKVFDAPEFSSSPRVSNSGEITYPLLGTLQVAGKTVSSAEKMLEECLKQGGVLLDPQVQITITHYATQAVSVLGQVRSPGSYNMLGPHSLMDAISAAGGFSPTAGASVTITHMNNSQPMVLTLDTSPGQSWKTNPQVFPGDRIEVDRAPIVYVLGDVGRPGGFVLSNRQTLTLVKAIALAEGTNGTAALKRVRLLRKDSTGDVKETMVSVKQVLSGKTPDITLQDDDVIYVPSSATKVAFHTTASLVRSTAQTAIYHAGW